MQKYCATRKNILTATFFLLSAVLATPQLAVAADAPVKIILSTQVQEMLRHASLDRKKRLKRTIQASNIFATQFLDGSIFQDDRYWQERTGALLSMSGLKFMQMAYEWGVPGEALLVCPNVQLADVTVSANGEFSATYRGIRIGLMIAAGTQFNVPKPEVPYSERFLPKDKGSIYELKLVLDANNKVKEVFPQDKLIANSYRVFRSSPNLRQPIYAGETNELVQARVASFDQADKDMDEAAATVCESPLSNNEFTTEGR